MPYQGGRRGECAKYHGTTFKAVIGTKGKNWFFTSFKKGVSNSDLRAEVQRHTAEIS